VISRTEKLITNLHGFRNAQVHVFGSTESDLMLPSSDIDLCVLAGNDNHNAKRSVFTLANAFRNCGTARDVTAIAHARVPIVKFTDKITGLSLDICFDNPTATEGGKLKRSRMHDLPALKPLVLVIKQFLAVRQMNETFSGGVGSFLVLMMVSNFLKVCLLCCTANVLSI
jgi:DNA polymerase sigma